MTNTIAGYAIFIAALGMMAGLIAPEVSNLHTWGDAMGPAFVGKMIAHFGIVAGAFAGGKLLPGPGESK